MGEQVTIHVSDDVARRAARAAARDHRRLEDVLSDWLEWAAQEMPVDMLPDADVLALADSQLGATDQERLDDLLGRNREGTLDDAGRRALDALMQVYEQGMLRKAQALRVAVQRGLRGPLSA